MFTEEQLRKLIFTVDSSCIFDRKIDLILKGKKYNISRSRPLAVVDKYLYQVRLDDVEVAVDRFEAWKNRTRLNGHYASHPY